MSGQSASDRPKSSIRARTGPADKLSLTVSVLLAGGFLVATVTPYQNAQIDRLQSPKPITGQAPKKTLENPVDQQTKSATAPVIRLPPPPIFASKRPPLKPARQVAKKQQAVKPLKRIVVVRPESALRSMLKIRPLKSVKPAFVPLVQVRPQPMPKLKPEVKQLIVKKQPVTAPLAFKPVVSDKQLPESSQTMVDGTQNRKVGGALLRLLEHGQGPAIEIAWPQRAAGRRALYNQLIQCYGVKAAVLVEGNKLFVTSSMVGEAWSIDMDQFSLFIRSPRGEAIPEEARVFAGIADRHGLTGWRAVRVFPRQVDAALLGGLGAVVGAQYKSAKQIRAAYRWNRTGLILGDFNVDGRPFDGTVTLPLPRGPARLPGCN